MLLSRCLDTRRVVALLGLSFVAGVAHALLVPGNTITVGPAVGQVAASLVTFLLIRRRAQAGGRVSGFFTPWGWALRALLWPVSYPREVANEHGWPAARADLGRLVLLVFGMIVAALLGLAVVRELS
jgi:hypothetical protein